MDNRKYADPFTGKVKSNRHARFCSQRRKDIFLISDVQWPPVCGWSKSHKEYLLPDATFWTKECGKEYPAEKAYPKRYWRSKAGVELRRYCNRRFRKQKREFSGKSNDYRRCTEFWWELY